MTTGGRLRLVALVVAAAVSLGACGGIQARRERAERVIGSVDKAIAAKSAQMAVSQQVDVKLDRTDRLAAGGAQSAAVPSITFAAQADLGHGRVAYLAGGGGSPQAVRVYSGMTVYAKRLADPKATTTTKRPWVQLDLTSLDPDQIDNGNVEVPEAVRRLRQVQGLENPLFLLELLRGTLSGSVHEVGREPVRGVPTTHYKLNIDRDKAVKGENQHVQDAYEALFKSMFATRTVLPGEVWLDDHGLPRRYTITLKSSVRRQSLADFRITVEMFDVGQPVRIVLPGSQETARVDDLGSLTEAITGGRA